VEHLHSTQIVAVRQEAHAGGVGILACTKRFAYSIGNHTVRLIRRLWSHVHCIGAADFTVAMWDLGHGGGSILGVFLVNLSVSMGLFSLKRCYRACFLRCPAPDP
jgi:hypothetical protein